MMKPLVLSGRAAGLEIAGEDEGRSVFRVQDLQEELSPRSERDVALVRESTDWDRAAQAGFTLALSRTPPPAGASKINYVQLGREFAELGDRDVLRLRRERAGVRVLYRRASEHNAILVTERCNNYCLMCSQPPKAVDDSWILEEISEAVPLIDPGTNGLTFTGGEPLTEWRRFLGVLEQTRDQLPDTAIHVLTNGRAFASVEIAKAWADLRHPRLSAGIPVYSAVDQIHDYVVQARGAFDETVLGILRLKDQAQRVEVRIVLHAITAPRLRETCAWLARNLPFVDHVALMGLENTGFAIANDAELWIDPLDYQADLAAGVDILASAGVRTSVYNLPLCVLDQAVWPFSVQSISDWKNAYVDECARCGVRDRCAGFFSTGRPKFSRGIHAMGTLA